jgi:hypothetical protein
MTSPSGRAHVTARIGVNLPWHAKMIRIPKGPARAAALGVWTVATCYARGHETDGFCPFEQLESYMTDDTVALLVDVGLFAIDEQNGLRGVRVLRYDEFNETKEQIDKRLAKDRKRKKKSASRIPSGIQVESDRIPNGFRVDGWSGTGMVKDQDPDPDLKAPEPVAPDPPQPNPEQRYAEAYARGIAKGTGAPAMPTADTFERGAINRVVQASGKRGDALVAWLEWAATRYVYAKPDPKFERGYSPKKFEEWVRGGGLPAAPQPKPVQARPRAEPAQAVVPPPANLGDALKTIGLGPSQVTSRNNSANDPKVQP